jgi:hypothetical protein
MSGERFPRDRPAAAARASAQAAERIAAETVAISARYRGVDGPGTVGGDFYARCETAYGTRVIIGDVRGKGAPAARKARFLASAFLVIATARPDLGSVSSALDHLAAADAASEWDVAACEWFATAVLLEIDRQGRSVTVINHGHPAPVLVDGGAGTGAGAVRELVPSRPWLPLGLGDLAAVGGLADTVELAADSTLLLFTDGVSEARDRAGRMFDPVAWLTAKAAGAVSEANAPNATNAPNADNAIGAADTPDTNNAASLAGTADAANAGSAHANNARGATNASSVRNNAGSMHNTAGPDDPAVLDSLLVEVERHNGGAWRDDLALVSVRRRVVPLGSPLTPLPLPTSRMPPVTLPPAMVPSAPADRRPVAPPRPRAPRNPPRRPGNGWPFADGTMLP